MVQPNERFQTQITLLEKALKTLESVLNEPYTDVVRDAIIQRFEYVFELSWKSMQLALRLRGVDVQTPRDSIKGAFKVGWVEDPESWLQAMDARNKTNEELAEDVLVVARQIPTLTRQLLKGLKKF